MNNDKKAALILGALILLSAGLFVHGFVKTEYSKYPHIEQKVEQGDAKYLYKFIFSGEPAIGGRPYYGRGDAPVVLVVYTRIVDCAACKEYFGEFYKIIEGEYVSSGIARIIPKYALSREDYVAKNEHYQLASALACVQKVDGSKYWDYFLGLQQAATIDPFVEAEARGISADAFKYCMETFASTELLEDMAETENFGITGLTPATYLIFGGERQVFYGVPSNTSFRQAMQHIKFTLGHP